MEDASRGWLKLPDIKNKRKRKQVMQAMLHPHIDGQRVTGIATAQGHVYVSTCEMLSRHKLVTQWTPDEHWKFPLPFREAARQILMGDLPLPDHLLMKILKDAAFPVHAWWRQSEKESANAQGEGREGREGREEGAPGQASGGACGARWEGRLRQR